MIPGNKELQTNFDPITPGLNSLRVMKYKEHKTDRNPVDVILEWKDSIYKDVITAVSHSPFHIFYQSALQIAWYVAESRKQRISISIDATGSVVTPPARSQKIFGTDKLKHIFLYSVMAKTASKSVPIAQMLSQDQSSDFIAFFLRKTWQQLKLPIEIVCDESKALMKAIVVTFADCDGIEEYIKQCVSALINHTALPKCYLRIDVAHFIKNIMRKIKDRDFRRNIFFRGVIGYLIKCDKFENALRVIFHFFTVILNKYDGDLGSQPTPAEESKKILLGLIGSHDEDVECSEDLCEEDDDGLNVNVECCWITEIINKVSIIDSGPHDNIYFNADDKAMYIKIFSTITLWSNVMNSSFVSTTTTATSADVEGYFKDLKTLILERKKLQAHTFLERHLEYINAEIKLAACKPESNLKNDVQKRKRSNSLESIPKAKNNHPRRSSSNQFDFPDIEPATIENGKNSFLRLYILVNSIFADRKRTLRQNDYRMLWWHHRLNTNKNTRSI